MEGASMLTLRSLASERLHRAHLSHESGVGSKFCTGNQSLLTDGEALSTIEFVKLWFRSKTLFLTYRGKLKWTPNFTSPNLY